MRATWLQVVTAIPQRETVDFESKNRYIEFPARVRLRSAYMIEGWEES